MKTMHLDFILGVINRLSILSAFIKVCAMIYFVGTLIAYSTGLAFPFWVFLVPFLLLWVLDSNILQSERNYRKLYNDVRDSDYDKYEYEYSLNIIVNGIDSYLPLSSIFSKTMLMYYLPLLVILSILSFL